MDSEFEFRDGTLTGKRIYAAPRELVFEAWVETGKTEQWWGCADCTNVRSEIEPHVGGKYNHHMTIKGQFDVPGDGVLVEFDPPSKLAYESALPMNEGVHMRVDVEFIEVAEGTLVVLTHSGIPAIRVEGDCEMHEIIQAGWTAALGKLAVFLGAKTQS